MKMQGKLFFTIGILFATSTTAIAQANTFTDPNPQRGQNLSVAITGQNTHFAQGSPTLTSINPDSGLQGQSLPVTITGQNTHFTQGSGTMGVWFSQGSPTVNIYATSYSASSDTSVNASFDIPIDATLGSWNVNVHDGVDGTLTLADGFTIYCLKNGDLLLCRSYKSFIPNVDFWTHVGIYHQPSDTVIEARAHPDWVVSIYPLTDWFYPNQTCVEILRVKTDDSTRDKAVEFALGKAGQSFDWSSLLLNKKQEGGECYLCKKWYCSELVWAAYLSASNGQINLDQDEAGLVSPDDIDSDDDVEMIGEHKEAIPQRAYWHVLWGEAYSPVDLEITDPDGLILNKQGSAISGGTYEEIDVDEDGDLEDLFVIPEPKVGSYLIQVIPEPNVLPDDTYSLVVTTDDQTMVLAEDVQIEDIPTQPYKVESKLCYSDFDGDGDVDFADYAFFASHWADVDCNDPNWCEGTDLNYSGIVDSNDLGIFAGDWLWEKIPADIDIDGDVDFADYAVFADRWMDQGCTHASWCNGADLNKSGEVDIFDLRILAEHWLEGH